MAEKVKKISSIASLDESTKPALPDYEEPPRFQHHYRKASCWNRWWFQYPRNLIDAHKANNYNMTCEMLDDMREHDDETT